MSAANGTNETVGRVVDMGGYHGRFDEGKLGEDVVEVKELPYMSITDREVAVIAAKCPSLTSLSLNTCKQVTDEGLRVLAEGCPSLTSLNLGGCSKVTDEGLRVLAEGCPSLSSLNLVCCDKVTDEGRRLVALGCLGIGWDELLASGVVAAGPETLALCAERSTDGGNILHRLACSHPSRADAFTAAVQAGANPFALNSDGLPPHALDTRPPAAASTLVPIMIEHATAHPDVITPESSVVVCLALATIASSRTSLYSNLIQQAGDAGFDLSTPDPANNNNTLLHTLAARQPTNADAFTAAVQAGANPFALNSDNLPPHALGPATSAVTLAPLMLDVLKTSPNSLTDTPALVLHAYARASSVNPINSVPLLNDILDTCGRDCVNTPEPGTGQFPLHLAVAANSITSIKYLMAAGANEFAVNENNGQPPNHGASDAIDRILTGSEPIPDKLKAQFGNDCSPPASSSSAATSAVSNGSVAAERVLALEARVSVLENTVHIPSESSSLRGALTTIGALMEQLNDQNAEMERLREENRALRLGNAPSPRRQEYDAGDVSAIEKELASTKEAYRVKVSQLNQDLRAAQSDPHASASASASASSPQAGHTKSGADDLIVSLRAELTETKAALEASLAAHNALQDQFDQLAKKGEGKVSGHALTALRTAHEHLVHEISLTLGSGVDAENVVRTYSCVLDELKHTLQHTSS